MIYIDFDDTLMDTYEPLFGDYVRDNENIKFISNKEIVKGKNWNKVLSSSEEINEGIKIIKLLDPEKICILTKIHSLENEGVAKIKFLRKMGVCCNIILVPYEVDKVEMVQAKGNVLIDDNIYNLEKWEEDGGIGIFFSKDCSKIDGFGRVNKKFKQIDSLNYLLDTHLKVKKKVVLE